MLTAASRAPRHPHNHVLLSPQTLKIVRTAELSPFIVFIAPTDKAEEVSDGGSCRVSSHLGRGWRGAETFWQPRALLPAL